MWGATCGGMQWKTGERQLFSFQLLQLQWPISSVSARCSLGLTVQQGCFKAGFGMDITLTQGLMMKVDSLSAKQCPLAQQEITDLQSTHGVAQHAQMALSQQLHTLRVYHAPAGWVAQLWASVSCFLLLGGKARWEYNKGQSWLRAKLGREHRFGPAWSCLLAAAVMWGN